MIRTNRQKIQYNPLFIDSSKNHTFEDDIFLYDTTSNTIYEKEVDTNGCFYWFNETISKFLYYFTAPK